MVQYAGAMLTSIREDDEGENGVMTNKQQIGIYVYMAGLGVQLSFILIFSAVAWRFRTKAVIEEARNQGTQRETSWRRLLMILYITLGMIIVRQPDLPIDSFVTRGAACDPLTSSRFE